ncbi:MAG TPA: DUF1656 domain-containing protein [Sulfurovum sp.]|nr:DUF1656 domain-containing protein [Sulfurovum sp.]
MQNNFPHELTAGDVYFSPMLLVIVLAFLLAGITAIVLNKLKLSRYIYAPAYVFAAIMVLYMVLIDAYWIKF